MVTRMWAVSISPLKQSGKSKPLLRMHEPAENQEAALAGRAFHETPYSGVIHLVSAFRLFFPQRSDPLLR
jgi:hypothetical protein